MSANTPGTQTTTPTQVVVALLAGLLAPILAIFLVVKLVVGIHANQIDHDNPQMSNKAVDARLKPVGEVTIVDANAPRVEKSGEEVVTAVCAACHASGALGAPKIGNAGDWGPRIKQGYETLIKHATEGIRQMPAKGGDPSLSDIEIARAVAFMANKGGAKFTPPEPKAPAAAAQGATANAAGTAPVAAAGAASAPATAPAAGASAAAAVPAPGAASAGASGADKGKSVYESTCATCHASGVAGAPKFGDKAAWAPRIKTGLDALHASALKGKNAMPPKGGNAALSDDDVKAAVDYMVSQSK